MVRADIARAAAHPVGPEQHHFLEEAEKTIGKIEEVFPDVISGINTGLYSRLKIEYDIWEQKKAKIVPG